MSAPGTSPRLDVLVTCRPHDRERTRDAERIADQVRRRFDFELVVTKVRAAIGL